MAPIWQRALDVLRKTDHVSSFGSKTFDECVLLSVFGELYAIGERPSVPEVREYLKRRAPRAHYWNRAVADRWRRFTRRPATKFKALRNHTYPHRYPFLWITDLLDADELARIPAQLRRMAHDAVDAYADATEASDDAAIEAAEFEIRRSLRALMVWALVSRPDRESFGWWGLALHPDVRIRFTPLRAEEQ